MNNTKLTQHTTVIEKITKALENWCIAYKIIGTPPETPRYSQLMKREGVFTLHSTQKELFYNLELTESENNFLASFEYSDLWEQYKQFRTTYLTTNHPTINAY